MMNLFQSADVTTDETMEDCIICVFPRMKPAGQSSKSFAHGHPQWRLEDRWLWEVSVQLVEKMESAIELPGNLPMASNG